ncbi:GatB/YqeY domain-containing protein [Propionicimonas sp.]|uniref:GatB/YqeY domain-containing protein n=1 Tax=Propionicimonas sp. TaxID=1955623 RepID=UPI001859291D|nr:GatB/YqeY domain-containing protein [Propionicimonas sp.]MBU3977323.1 GatB/YqeY domain-containing protein [Actinomycetota bacterium]MBA3021248.1 GatB/YqeY domain-containing protein [Propionicimonas sp.]MBU3985833.1 GatB/YqeY domain-containing protein [Actinomycetota bacterium]MBU4008618.1 GatB/YqeY domain-containing protein [Actinomycetota bacterium]MBU4066232.1 GatB/YqeY domain-containing protein [Actinomycetota bacterium]
MSELAQQIQADMVASMKAHDDLTRSTLRMAISAIKNEQVAGKQARELTDSDVVIVLNREVAKRRDSAEAYTSGNRPELAAKELAEIEVLQRYLPAALSDAELDVLIANALAQAEAQLGAKPTLKQMGVVMKTVTAEVAGRAEGGKVAAKVKAALA